ncbi:MAG: ATP-binding protein [Candidatus Melainabacteria bacterium]|nr:ATP-binding protein [Candidatus Melainabacteria bacterium]
MILLAVLLVSELAFVWTLRELCNNAEKEARRLGNARQVISKATQLMLLVYDTGDAVGKFTTTHGTDATQRYQTSKDEIPGIMKWLNKNLKGRPNEMKLLKRIQDNMSICLPVIVKIHKESENLPQAEAMQAWREGRKTIVQHADRLIGDLNKLIDSARQIDNEAPEIERKQREEFRRALYFGLITNAALCILLGAFFIVRVTRRLNIIVDNTGRLKNGLPLNAPVGGSDEPAEVDSVFHDTAVKVRAEEDLLKDSERRLRMIIERAPIGLLLINKVGTIELFNGSIEQSFGYEPHELLNKNLSKLLGSAKSQGSTRLMAGLAERAIGHIVELNAVRKSGEEFPIDFALAEVEFGQQNRKLAIILDATERIAVRNLRQSFVTMVSTELGNPLANVKAFLNRLSGGEYGETSEKINKESIRASDNIERLILLLNDLFDLEKLEAGRIDIEARWCSLQPIIDKSVSAVSVFAQQHKVEIEVEAADCALFADSNRIVQVLINFLSNAIKYSPPDSSVTIAIDTPQESFVVIKVIDRGRGIPPSHISAVFERFQQVEANDAKKKGGTGLGLAICKAIIEEHGGTIGVDSEEGKGSSFWFKLPIPKVSK